MLGLFTRAFALILSVLLISCTKTNEVKENAHINAIDNYIASVSNNPIFNDLVKIIHDNDVGFGIHNTVRLEVNGKSNVDSFVIDGQERTLVNDNAFNIWRSVMNQYAKSILGPPFKNSIKKDKIYHVLICIDLSNGGIYNNGETVTAPFIYEVTTMNESHMGGISTICTPEAFSPLIYKNQGTSTAEFSKSKVELAKADPNKPTYQHDKFVASMWDLVGIVYTKVFSDPDMIQAIKDDLAVSGADGSAKGSKGQLNTSKSQCSALGFKPGSKDFGKCVMRLIDGG